MQVFLNGNDITNREQLHDALSEALEPLQPGLAVTG